MAKPWHFQARRDRRPRVLLLSAVLDPATEIGVTVALQARYLGERGYDVVVGAPFPVLAKAQPAVSHVALDDGQRAAALAGAWGIDAIIAHTPNFGDVSRWLGARPPVLIHYHGEAAEAASGVGDEIFRKEARLLALPFVAAVLAPSPAAAKELAVRDALVHPPGADRVGLWSSALMPLREEVRRHRDWSGKIVILVASETGAVDAALRTSLDALIATLDLATVAVVLLTSDLRPARNLAPGMTAVAPATVAERQGLLAGADIYLGAPGSEGSLEAIEAAALGLLVVERPALITPGQADRVARDLAAAAAQAGLPDAWSRRAAPSPGWAETLGVLEETLAAMTGLAGPAPAQAGAMLAPAALIVASGLFDIDFYLAHNVDVPRTAARGHFLDHGHREGRPFSPLFDTRWYVEQYPEAKRAAGGALLDYLRHPQGLRDPNPFFSNAAYLAATDGRDLGGRAPLIHYLQEGAAEGLPVGDAFDGAFYLAAYPDVAASGLAPLAHFLKIGRAEGRQPLPVPPSPVDLFDDADVARAVGGEAADIAPRPAAADEIHGKSSAARFIFTLLRGDADLRRRFPRALSEGPDGAFAAWLAGAGGTRLGVSAKAREHIAALFRADIAARVRQLYFIKPEISAANPLALTPAGAGDFLRWAADGGIADEGLDREAVWWFLLVAAEQPAHGIVDTYLFSAVWQALFPDGITVFGREAFGRWLRETFTLHDAWADPAQWPLPLSADEQIRIAYHARAEWRQAHPDAFASAGGAAALLDWLASPPAALSPAARAWLAAQDRAGLTERLTAPGINMLGHFCYASGLRTSTESLVEGVRRNGGGVALRDVWVQEHGDENRHGDYAGLEIYDTTIIHTQPEPLFDRAYTRANLAPRTPRTYRIGYWYWELDTIPAHWQEQADQVDEIWTATKFVGDALRERFDLPVRVIMPGLEHPPFESLPRSHFGLPEGTFLFLFTFHMASIMERKNPLGLIAAFIAAFGKDTSVGLVLKTSFGHMYPDQLTELREAGDGYNVIIIDDVYTKEEVLALMETCDAYVSLHRSEGYGLTMAEAMLLAKPVIATGYSGNLDFMSEDTSLLVRYEMVTLDRDCPPYKAGMQWAHASIPHAAECMRKVRDNPDYARDLGRRAKADLAKRMSLETSGGKIVRRLHEIHALRKQAAGGDGNSRVQ